MKIIAIWHSNMAHLTAFANHWFCDLVAVVPDEDIYGFWAVYRVTTDVYENITADKKVMWK